MADVETRELSRSIGLEKMRQDFVQHGCRTRGFAYGTIEAYWDTVVNPFTLDWSSTATQVGGFAGATTVNNGNGTITVTIPNEAGAKSFFLHIPPNSPFSRGPLRTIKQRFEWTEYLPAGCPPK
jgi:hypothetical protein